MNGDEQFTQKMKGKSFYKSASDDVGFWKREVLKNLRDRQKTRNPLRWLEALLLEAEARLELRWAKSWKQKIEQGMAYAADHQGQKDADKPAHDPKTVACVFVACAALAATPGNSELSPSPARKAEVAMAKATVLFCSTSGNPAPAHRAPCCAPKNGLEIRRTGKNGGPNLDMA